MSGEFARNRLKCNTTSLNLHNLLIVKGFFRGLGFFIVHGIKKKAEVGMWNSEIRPKDNFKIPPSPFRILD